MHHHQQDLRLNPRENETPEYLEANAPQKAASWFCRGDMFGNFARQ